MLREISLDKLRPWKSFFRVRKQRELASRLPLDTRVSNRRGTNLAQVNGTDVENAGYEVYVDGPTRVLRISNSSGRRKADCKYQSCKKIQLRISYFAIRLLEPCKQVSQRIQQIIVIKDYHGLCNIFCDAYYLDIVHAYGEGIYTLFYFSPPLSSLLIYFNICQKKKKSTC